jgi:hypothetical protein
MNLMHRLWKLIEKIWKEENSSQRLARRANMSYLQERRLNTCENYRSDTISKATTCCETFSVGLGWEGLLQTIYGQSEDERIRL